VSVHGRKRARGKMAYEVIWRDGDGGQRCETFSTRRQAAARDREIRDLRSRGKDGAVDAGSEPLREAAERWWTDHVEPSIAISTSKVYATVLDRHLLARLGERPIRDILPGDVIALQSDLRGDGIGEHMTQKTLMVLSGIMRHSQLLGRIPLNPVSPVRIKQPRRKRAIRPLTPEAVERMRANSLGLGRLREATILSVLAYSGLRPGEVFALSWDCVGERTLIVEHGRADGSLKATKTDRIRTVTLLGSLVSDLAAWRAAAPALGSALLFPRADGDVFRDTDYRNWRTRHFDPAALAAGADGATPYTLRHSFASLLVQAGWNALEISSEMGNSPEVVQRDYSHLFREFARGQRIDPEEMIVAARRALASGRSGEVSADGRSA
jgi:integrase